ncbi:MAG: 2-pyrone-4,6-dicarboxylate hydrolase [Alphaproteobacteria bacterium]|nr:2-pyrone-4,6-dicarboxylate hydrolase [Alphaproteobacteria bacterium]
MIKTFVPRTAVSKPKFAMPAKACDAAVHVFGPKDKYPADPNRKYDHPLVTPADVMTMHGNLGIQRGVLIQSVIYKSDNRAMLDALKQLKGRYRGIAIIDESTTDDELKMMHELGVRGVRFNFMRFYESAPTVEFFNQVIKRINAYGWHVVVHGEAEDILHYESTFRKIPIPFIIDHIAHMPIKEGTDQKPFRVLLKLLELDNCWVKIANTDRWSVEGAPHYRDGIPFIKAMVDTAPERLIWATDWPHVVYKNWHKFNDPLPDDGDLLNLMHEAVPNAANLKRILVDNPHRLYGFTD